MGMIAESCMSTALTVTHLCVQWIGVCKIPKICPQKKITSYGATKVNDLWVGNFFTCVNTTVLSF